MASYKTEISGAILHAPQTGQDVPRGSVSIPFQGIVQASSKYENGVISASGAVDAALNMGSVTNAKIVMIQKAAGSMKFKLTTSDGIDQILPVGRLFVWDNAEKPVTAIKYSGTGDFEFLLVEW